MREITSQLHIARHLLMQDAAWLLFVEIPTTVETFFRLVRASRHLEADGKKWQACSMAIEPPAEEIEGSLGALAISIPNVSRLPMAYVEQDVENGRGELLHQTATLWLQHESHLETFEPGLSWKHRILRATADEQVMRIECGHPAQMTRVPSRMFTRREFPQLLAQGVR